MGEVSTIGLDIAKSAFQIHGVDSDGAVVIRKRMSRAAVMIDSKLQGILVYRSQTIGLSLWIHASEPKTESRPSQLPALSFQAGSTMSLIGPKQTSYPRYLMSALGGKADTEKSARHVAFLPKTDMCGTFHQFWCLEPKM